MKFKEYLNELINTYAFWISPKGEIVGGLTKHINQVIKAPAKFGLTRDYVEQEYKNYGEKIGQEGKARENIIRKLMFAGFTRIRKYSNAGWTVNILMASKHLNKNYLTAWAKKMITTGIDGVKETDKETKVTITDLGRYRKEMTITELANGVLLNENNQQVELILCQSIYEFSDHPLII